ncbi:BfmA/BtgA family mobilization protein [Catalinimonas niigatensis]|uniref:BfmA/BtgA family mobilization protein n=1 Tax=Catalinimonas niigatensis TaxID=1397264 RepID=UPI002666CE7F|nr:BfmA/BtgA family mobilization protein [Catalinimonas niigatensis]WPP51769.1 BfmA/BtgA family mobilization protein [Catalinimonas niigatensis]
MSSSKKINVSNLIHKQIDEESRRLKLSHKDYLEACTAFFLERHLDPRIYQPETSKQSIQQAVDRIFSYLSYQEKHQLRDLYLETVKARILSELSVNHLLTLITEDEATYRQLQQQDQQYLSERLKQVSEKQNIND